MSLRSIFQYAWCFNPSIKYHYFLSFSAACSMSWALQCASAIFLVLLFPRPQRVPRGFDSFGQRFFCWTKIEASWDENQKEGLGARRMCSRGWTCRACLALFWERKRLVKIITDFWKQNHVVFGRNGVESEVELPQDSNWSESARYYQATISIIIIEILFIARRDWNLITIP